MRNLELKLKGCAGIVPVVKIDNKYIKLKNNSFGNRVANFQTDKEKVNVKVYRYLELGGKFWLLAEIFFFLISLFGILDAKRDRNAVVLDVDLDVILTEQTSLELALNTKKGNDKGASIESNAEVQENSNVCFVDKVVAKRKKALIFIKIGIFVAVAALIAFVII